MWRFHPHLCSAKLDRTAQAAVGMIAAKRNQSSAPKLLDMPRRVKVRRATVSSARGKRIELRMRRCGPRTSLGST